MCGHYMGQDWLDFFCSHDAVREEGLEEGAVHVRVAFVWRHFANHGRIVSRHFGLAAKLVMRQGKC
jgi:hypothetical protein